MRIAGFGFSRKPDHFETDEILNATSQRRLRKFHERLEKSIFAANREILSSRVKTLENDLFMRLAVKVTNARTNYVEHVLKIAGNEGGITSDEIDTLAKERRELDELIHGFDAVVRLVDRGYVTFVDNPNAANN